jgi:hypothetical protein
MVNPEQVPSPKEEQAEKKVESININGEKLLAAITSENFLNALKIAGEITDETGRETSFNTAVFGDGTVYIPHVLVGGSGDTAEANDFDKPTRTKIDDYVDKPSAYLLGFHFHPNKEGSIIPSNGDLSTILDVPFTAIGQIRENKEIKILLIQRKKNNVDSELPENIEQYVEGTYDTMSQEEVHDVLDKSGFESFLIEFAFKKGIYSIEKSSIKKLKKVKERKLELENTTTLIIQL